MNSNRACSSCCIPIGPSSSSTNSGQFWRDAERRQERQHQRGRSRGCDKSPNRDEWGFGWGHQSPTWWEEHNPHGEWQWQDTDWDHTAWNWKRSTPETASSSTGARARSCLRQPSAVRRRSYPAICALAAERVPLLHQLLNELSDLHAGERLLKCQQAGNYTQLHSVFHSDPECSVGNHNLALVGAWLAPQLHSVFQNVTKVGDMVKGWLAHLRAGGTVDADANSDLFVQTVELVKPLTTLAGQSSQSHSLLE